jgi:hypothetical protein
LELEKAAKHGAQHGVKIKKPWDSADGYENWAIRRKNAGAFRLSTLKVARKSFVFKGV